MNEKPDKVIPLFLCAAIIGSEAAHILSPPHTKQFYTSEVQTEVVPNRHQDALPVHAPLGHEDGDNVPKEESLKLSAATTGNMVTRSISIPIETLQSVSSTGHF